MGGGTGYVGPGMQRPGPTGMTKPGTIGGAGPKGPPDFAPPQNPYNAGFGMSNGPQATGGGTANQVTRNDPNAQGRINDYTEQQRQAYIAAGGDPNKFQQFDPTAGAYAGFEQGQARHEARLADRNRFYEQQMARLNQTQQPTPMPSITTDPKTGNRQPGTKEGYTQNAGNPQMYGSVQSTGAGYNPLGDPNLTTQSAIRAQGAPQIGQIQNLPQGVRQIQPNGQGLPGGGWPGLTQHRAQQGQGGGK